MKIILKRISLFGALALAAILLMSCRASPDVAELECWIVFRHGSSCTVTNAEGESLTYRDDGAVLARWSAMSPPMVVSATTTA